MWIDKIYESETIYLKTILTVCFKSWFNIANWHQSHKKDNKYVNYFALFIFSSYYEHWGF